MLAGNWMRTLYMLGSIYSKFLVLRSWCIACLSLKKSKKKKKEDNFLQSILEFRTVRGGFHPCQTNNVSAVGHPTMSSFHFLVEFFYFLLCFYLFVFFLVCFVMEMQHTMWKSTNKGKVRRESFYMGFNQKPSW